VTRPRPDVVIATDCRLPGGTTGSVAEELAAQHRAGLRSSLLHLPSSLSTRPRPFAPRLRALIGAGACEVVVHDEVECDLLVIRHPRVAAELAPTAPTVRATRVLMIANQAPGRPGGGTEHYDPAEANARVQDWTGVTPAWIPIGPLVRQNLQETVPDLPLAPDDWVNIIDAPRWATRRTGPHRPVRIGRHSRDHALKWPASRSELLAAYPDTPDVEIRALGGADTPRSLLGGQLPTNWHVDAFGALSPERFLAGIDVFVYHHHPAWVEAFGRTVIEAMASGAPAVLSRSFEPLFGGIATLVDPAGTLAAVQELTADAATYRSRSEAAVEAVTERFSYSTHLRRLEQHGVELRRAEANSTVAPSPAHHPAPDGRRVLLVSSNGAGVGHLMRLMAIARRFPDDVQPSFLTLSQAVRVVDDLGFPVEYLPSRGALGAPHRAWQRLLRDRLTELLDDLDVAAVVFDGTWPYDGLLDALDTRPDVLRVWSRRAMWRADVERHVLHLAGRFDLVVEPGEAAAALDEGPTARRRHEATQVGPITFLRSSELLSREEARQELGLADDALAVLVQLGAGNINDTSTVLGATIEQLGAAVPGASIHVTRSVISTSAAVPVGVHSISTYPLARVLRGFDLAVAAAGYNTFHELLGAGVPTVFVPNLETATDDQAARARWAEQQGIGAAVPDVTDGRLWAAARRLLDAPRGTAPSADDGAQQAADAIVAALASGPDHGARAAAEVPPSSARAAGWRGRAVTAARALPGPVQDAVFAAWRARPGAPSRGTGSSRIPVPAGPEEPSTTTSSAGTLVVLPEDVADETLRAVVHDIASLQRSFGGFRPFFVTASRDLEVFRELGYGVEILPSGKQLDPDAADAQRARRLEAYRRHYAVDRVVRLTAGDLERRDLAALLT
jgi:UDP:flavonoid glycosyltransferase YjiC (YdhE family)